MCVVNNLFSMVYSISVSILSQLYEDNGYTYKPVLQAVEWLQRYFSRDPSVLSQPRPDICFLDRNEGIANFYLTLLYDVHAN